MVTLDNRYLKIGRSCLNISTYGRLKISETISETFSCKEDACNLTAKLASNRNSVCLASFCFMLLRFIF